MSTVDPKRPRSWSELARSIYPGHATEEKKQEPARSPNWWEQKQPPSPNWAGFAHLYGLKKKGK
jgi:hypothetical protein